MVRKQNLNSLHTVNWGRLIFLSSMAIVTLVGVPLYLFRFGISAPNLFIFIFWAVATEMAITVGYHRLFAHFAFKTNPLVTFLCLFFGLKKMASATLFPTVMPS